MLLVAFTTAHVRGLGAALVAVDPGVQRTAHALCQALALASIPLPMPLAPLRPGPEGEAEVCALLAFLQLSVGLLLPLMWEAASKARLLEQQQRQRAAARLPPERSADAWLCACVRAATGRGSRPRTALACWALLALTWNACAIWFAYS